MRLDTGASSSRSLLCLGAHCDDIEIGCGGTVMKLISECGDLSIDWVVMSSNPQREEEAVRSASDFMAGALKRSIHVERFNDGFFPFRGGEIKDYFERLKGKTNPDIIFTHYRNDLHQDHRLVSELTWNTFRDHLILEYEIPKYDGDVGSPNFYVHLDEAICRRKVESISRHFRTQKGKHWFDEDVFMSLLRIRGVESNSVSRYAEGFYCRKMVC